MRKVLMSFLCFFSIFFLFFSVADVNGVSAYVTCPTGTTAIGSWNAYGTTSDGVNEDLTVDSEPQSGLLSKSVELKLLELEEAAITSSIMYMEDNYVYDVSDETLAKAEAAKKKVQAKIENLKSEIVAIEGENLVNEIKSDVSTDEEYIEALKEEEAKVGQELDEYISRYGDVATDESIEEFRNKITVLQNEIDNAQIIVGKGGTIIDSEDDIFLSAKDTMDINERLLSRTSDEYDDLIAERDAGEDVTSDIIDNLQNQKYLLDEKYDLKLKEYLDADLGSEEGEALGKEVKALDAQKREVRALLTQELEYANVQKDDTVEEDVAGIVVNLECNEYCQKLKHEEKEYTLEAYKNTLTPAEQNQEITDEDYLKYLDKSYEECEGNEGCEQYIGSLMATVLNGQNSGLLSQDSAISEAEVLAKALAEAQKLVDSDIAEAMEEYKDSSLKELLAEKEKIQDGEYSNVDDAYAASLAIEQLIDIKKDTCSARVGVCSDEDMQLVHSLGAEYTNEAIQDYIELLNAQNKVVQNYCGEDETTDRCKAAKKEAEEYSKDINQFTDTEMLSAVNAFSQTLNCQEGDEICEDAQDETLEVLRGVECSKKASYLDTLCQWTNYKNERQLATEYLSNAINSYYGQWKSNDPNNKMTMDDYNNMIGEVLISSVFTDGSLSYDVETNTYSLSGEVESFVDDYNDDLEDKIGVLEVKIGVLETEAVNNDDAINAFIDDLTYLAFDNENFEDLTPEEILKLEGLANEDKEKLLALIAERDSLVDALAEADSELASLGGELDGDSLTLEQLNDLVNQQYYEGCNWGEGAAPSIGMRGDGADNACLDKWGTLKTQVGEAYENEAVQTNIGYTILDSLRHPDSDALKAAKFFGFEADYTSLPKWLGNDIASSICLGKIDGYLDKDIESDGGVTRFTDGGTNDDGTPANELETMLDLRAKRTRMTPDGNLLVSYSYYVKAVDQKIVFDVFLTYNKGGIVSTFDIVKDVNVSDGGTSSQMDQIQIPFEEDEVGLIDEDSFEITLDAGSYNKVTVPVVLVGGGNYYNGETVDSPVGVTSSVSSSSSAVSSSSSSSGSTSSTSVVPTETSESTASSTSDTASTSSVSSESSEQVPVTSDGIPGYQDYRAGSTTPYTGDAVFFLDEGTTYDNCKIDGHSARSREDKNRQFWWADGYKAPSTVTVVCTKGGQSYTGTYNR